MLYPGDSLVTSRSLRSLLRNHLHSSGHPCIKGQDYQLARKEVTSPFRMDSRTSHETATSPMHASQEVHSPGTPAVGWGVVAGPSKGARQWRSVDGGLPTCFYPAMAKPAKARADRQESCGQVSCWSVISFLWHGHPFVFQPGKRNNIYRRPWAACWRRGP